MQAGTSGPQQNHLLTWSSQVSRGLYLHSAFADAMLASAATTSLNSETPDTCCHCPGSSGLPCRATVAQTCRQACLLCPLYCGGLQGQGSSQALFNIPTFLITCLCGRSQTPHPSMPYPVPILMADNTNLSQHSLRLSQIFDSTGSRQLIKLGLGIFNWEQFCPSENI